VRRGAGEGAGAGTIAVELEPYAVLAARVVDADGAPVAGATVSVTAWLRGTSGADGRVRIEDVRAGDARVAVRRAGEPVQIVPFAARAGETTDLGDLRPAPPLVVEGIVRSGAGAPLAGVLVSLLGPHADAVPRTATRPDGAFRCGLPAGAAGHLLFERRGHARAVAPIAPGPLAIRLGPPARLRVRLDMDPTPRWKPLLELPGGAVLDLMPAGTRESVAVLDDLPEGPAAVHVEGLAIDAVSRTANLTPGSPTDLTIQAP
jgi:hypothetical protein